MKNLFILALKEGQSLRVVVTDAPVQESANGLLP